MLTAFSVLFPVLPVLPVLHAQTRIAGQVITADSAPVARARVTLHRVGRDIQGPIDSGRADARGRFSFAFRPDTGALYLLSARRAGIEYFSPPVATNPARADSTVRIVVYDTSSGAPVTTEARHLVLTRPDDDGSRTILDLIVLQNEGRLTRVSADSVRPSWTGRLPSGTVGLQVGESDVSSAAMSRRDDSLIVTAPLAPGEKQLTIQYQVPRDRHSVELPLDQAGLRLNVLTEEPGVKVIGPGIELADSQMIQGRYFRRWTGVVSAPANIRLQLPDIGRMPRALLVALVAGLGLSLGGAGWYLVTRRRREVPPARADQLVDAIANLDARYLGRELETPPLEWSSYQTERARLKAELETSLAAGGWTG
jgi:hypothetical protein